MEDRFSSEKPKLPQGKPTGFFVSSDLSGVDQRGVSDKLFLSRFGSYPCVWEPSGANPYAEVVWRERSAMAALIRYSVTFGSCATAMTDGNIAWQLLASGAKLQSIRSSCHRRIGESCVHGVMNQPLKMADACIRSTPLNVLCLSGV